MKYEYPVTQKNAVIKNLVMISTKIKKMERRPAGELTGSQLIMLPMVASFDSPPSLGEVAVLAETSYQNVRTLLEKVARKGYVDLAIDPNDSRVLRVILTSKGKDAVEEYYAAMQEPIADIFRDLEESDIEATAKVLEVLSDRVDELNVQPTQGKFLAS